MVQNEIIKIRVRDLNFVTLPQRFKFLNLDKLFQVVNNAKNVSLQRYVYT